MILGLLGITGCAAQSDSIKSVSAPEFQRIIMNDSVVLVDVRTSEEFNAGHIGAAENIDVLKPDFKERATATLPTTKTIAVYCRSGKRSLKAADILATNGYRVVNLRGGWVEWTEFMKGKDR